MSVSFARIRPDRCVVRLQQLLGAAAFARLIAAAA
jgi:hypothetical protein